MRELPQLSQALFYVVSVKSVGWVAGAGREGKGALATMQISTRISYRKGARGAYVLAARLEGVPDCTMGCAGACPYTQSKLPSCPRQRGEILCQLSKSDSDDMP